MAKALNVEGWVSKDLGKLQHDIGQIHQKNLAKSYQTRSSLGHGDFSGYPVRFNTELIKSPRVRSYGSIKGGLVGTVSGFKAKDESWRMLNVLCHDRQLHQRYGATLVKANWHYKSNEQKIRREIRRRIG